MFIVDYFSGLFHQVNRKFFSPFVSSPPWPKWCVSADQFFLAGMLNRDPILMTNVNTAVMPGHLYLSCSARKWGDDGLCLNPCFRIFSESFTVTPKEDIPLPLETENKLHVECVLSCLNLKLLNIPRVLQYLILDYSIRAFDEFRKGDWVDVKLFSSGIGMAGAHFVWYQGIVQEVMDDEEARVHLVSFLESERTVPLSCLAPWNTRTAGK